MNESKKKNQNQYLTDNYHCCNCNGDQNTVPKKWKDHS